MSKLSTFEIIALAQRMFKYLRRYWKIFTVAIVFMFLFSATSMSRTLLGKFLLDDALKGPPSPLFAQYGLDRMGVLYTLCIISLGLALVIGITQFVQIYMRNYLQARIVVDVQNDVYHNLIKLSVGFYDRQKMGDLLARLTHDIGSTGVACRYLFGELILQPLMLLWGIIFCLYYSWQLSIITFILFPAIVVPVIQLGKRIHKRARRRQASIAEVTEEMQQMFTGIRVIKGFQSEEIQSNDFREKNENYFHRAMKVMKAKAASKSLVEFLNNFGVPLIMLVGGYFVIQGGFNLSVGDLIGFIGSTALMYAPIKTMSKSYNALQESLASTSRVFELLDAEPEIKDSPDAYELEKIEQGIQVENLSFAYEEEKVLKDVSFTVDVGEVIAIVGPSGAGKSTFLDLLMRFYDPQEGAIKIDGHDLRNLTRQSLMSKIAYVGQDPFLFNKSIGQNIAYGRPGATQDEIVEAARRANIHDFVDSLPEKYNTVVGERGAMLSGGQRQRLTIARAVLKKFSVLLLDEATSSLDSESEKLVQQALEKLMEGYTTFVIAHRLSTIQNVDRIMYFESGKLVDMAPHAELIERCDGYRRLYEMQFSANSSPNNK